MKNKWLGRICIVTVLTLLALVAAPAGAVFAATTADVAVNATPAYVSITCNKTAEGYGFGTVAVSTNYTTATGYFGITNSSSVITNQTIAVTGATWTGGVTWTHSDTGIPASDTVALFASKGTGVFDVIVKNAAPNNIATNQAATTDYAFELRLSAPTVFTDGVLKTNTVRITATAA